MNRPHDRSGVTLASHVTVEFAGSRFMIIDAFAVARRSNEADELYRTRSEPVRRVVDGMQLTERNHQPTVI